MKPFVKVADGKKWEIPTFDPLVAEHLGKESSYVETLLREINDGLYAPFFKDKENLTFLDIGANIGLVSAYAYPNCDRIIAVEPSPKTFQVLQALTVKLPKIECVQAALAPIEGQVDFFENNENTTASSTVNTFGRKTTVLGLKLSDILRIYQLEHVDVCKADCEGGEGDALAFSELQSAASIINCWYIEVHNCPKSSWNHKLGRLIADLTTVGYHSITIKGMTLVARK